MVNYQEGRIKLTNTQLNKLKSVAKNKAGTILRLNRKNFEDFLLAPLAASVGQPVISSVVKSLSGRGIRRARRRYMNKNF